MKETANRMALPLESGKLGAEDHTVKHKTCTMNTCSAPCLKTTRRGTHRGNSCKCVAKFVANTVKWCATNAECVRDVACRCAKKIAVRNLCVQLVALCSTALRVKSVALWSTAPPIGCGYLNREKTEWIMTDHLKVFCVTRTGRRK